MNTLKEVNMKAFIAVLIIGLLTLGCASTAWKKAGDASRDAGKQASEAVK